MKCTDPANYKVEANPPVVPVSSLNGSAQVLVPPIEASIDELTASDSGYIVVLYE